VLYGLMRASLLFYRKLRKEREDVGFTANPYDPCVANKDEGDRKQLTIIWLVDDLMASCVVDFELTKLSCYLANIYGPKLTMHVGNKHDYLGVDLEFQQDRRLNVLMVNYLRNVIEGFPEQIVVRAATPAADRLFDIRDKKEARPLEEECVIAIHHTTAQLIGMGTATWRGGVSGWCPAIVVIAPPQKEEDRDCMDDSNNNGNVDDVYDDIKRLR